jgi:hypothetical protein
VDPDTVFLSYLAVLAVVGIVLAVVEKRRPERTWNPSPAWFATLTVAMGPLPLQIYLAWDGEAPTTGFIVLCVVADVGMWWWAYFWRTKRRPPLVDSSRHQDPDAGRER